MNLSGSNLTVFVPQPRATPESSSGSTLPSPSSAAVPASRLPIAASSTLLLHNQVRPASHSHSAHGAASATSTPSAAASNGRPAAAPAAVVSNGRAARSPKLAEVVLLTGARGSSGHSSPAQSLTPRQLSPRIHATDSSLPSDPASKPVVSVSLSSITPEEESRAAAARKKHHRPALSLDEDDDPSQPIADRRARAVQWMLQTIDQREEPLYCPSWFTAVDAPAMLHLADVRQHYLSLVHSFSLRDQALSYIDDVHDAWLAEKTKLKARSKINMMRALQGKPLLISTQGTLQRMPGFMPTTATVTATPTQASTAASASPSSSAALINGAGVGGPITPRASARSVTSTAAAMLLHSSAASPHSAAAAVSPRASTGSISAPAATSPATPAAAPAAPAAALAPLPSARSRLANLSALLTPAPQPPPQQQSPAPPQLLSPSSSAAGLNGTIAGLSPIAHAAPAETDESALGADEPSQSRSSAAAPPPPPPAAEALDALLQGVDPSSLSAADLEAFAALEVLLDSFPLLIKHSPASTAVADGSRSKAKAPKLSELKLIGSRLFYGWKAHRKRNKKFVRLRDIVHVHAGLSERIAQRHEPVAAGSSAATPTLLDEYCFRIESLDSSTDPPTPCELNLQADSTAHRAQWIDGIRLLARFEQSRIEAAEAAEE